MNDSNFLLYFGFKIPSLIQRVTLLSDELLGTIVWQIMKFSCSLLTTLAVYRDSIRSENSVAYTTWDNREALEHFIPSSLLFCLKLNCTQATHFQFFTSFCALPKNLVKHLLHSTLNRPLLKLANTPNPQLANTAKRTERTESFKWEQKRHKNTVALETDILQSIFMPSRRRHAKLCRPSIHLSTLLSKSSAKVTGLFCPIIDVMCSIRLGSLHNLTHYLLFYPRVI